MALAASPPPYPRFSRYEQMSETLDDEIQNIRDESMILDPVRVPWLTSHSQFTYRTSQTPECNDSQQYRGSVSA